MVWKGPKGDWVDIGAPKKKVSSKHAVESLLKAVSVSTLNVYRDLKLKV